MHPADCPEWEYSELPNADDVLFLEVRRLVADFRSRPSDSEANITDTRGLHFRLFKFLTPAKHPYYAGHYRGEPFRCLRFMEVGVPSDHRVGYPPHSVLFAIASETPKILSCIKALDLAHDLPNRLLDNREKFKNCIVSAARIFEWFLRVHPFVNGNGHVARLVLWCLLGRYGYWPKRFPVHPRPPHPAYGDLISKYRDGDKTGLEIFIAKCVDGTI